VVAKGINGRGCWVLVSIVMPTGFSASSVDCDGGLRTPFPRARRNEGPSTRSCSRSCLFNVSLPSAAFSQVRHTSLQSASHSVRTGTACPSCASAHVVPGVHYPSISLQRRNERRRRLTSCGIPIRRTGTFCTSCWRPKVPREGSARQRWVEGRGAKLQVDHPPPQGPIGG
jgi:hypothetical protein